MWDTNIVQKKIKLITEQINDLLSNTIRMMELKVP